MVENPIELRGQIGLIRTESIRPVLNHLLHAATVATGSIGRVGLAPAEPDQIVDTAKGALIVGAVENRVRERQLDVSDV
jgi:hypothetical protein